MKNTLYRQSSAYVTIGRMSTEPLRGISITLSPAQIDEILRAAADSRAPSLSSVIAESLNAPLDATGTDGEGGRGGWRPPRSYPPPEGGDQRLSRSLLRGLSILTSFGPDGEARGIVEMAGDLGMSPSTAHRYALTLVELGLLERCPKTRKYRLPGSP
jgi:hypothetical protein